MTLDLVVDLAAEAPVDTEVEWPDVLHHVLTAELKVVQVIGIAFSWHRRAVPLLPIPTGIHGSIGCRDDQVK